MTTEIIIHFKNPPFLLLLLGLLRVPVEEQVGHDLPLKNNEGYLEVLRLWKRLLSVVILASNVDQTAFPIIGSS